MTPPTNTLPPSELDLSSLSDRGSAEVVARLVDKTAGAWAEAAARVGYCAHPIRLTGQSCRVDTTTGEVLDSFRSVDAPLGAVYVRCGNRREHVCPACSRTYARDTFAMITAGVSGGKTVPTTVTHNPLLFVTLTAPTFGPVHTATGDGSRCHPRIRLGACEHGRRRSCTRVHDPGDPVVGAPICPDCYDTTSAVVWQWWAPELWRRFTIALRRALAGLLGVRESRLKDVASVQYAKVAEYQARGMVHFHALIRLDGPAEHGIGAPATTDADTLTEAVRRAVAVVEYVAPAVDDDDVPRRLVFGTQTDIRTVRAGHRPDDPDGPITPGQVAGYLAKYATKDATDITGNSGRDRPHLAVLRQVAREFADRAIDADGVHSPYFQLGRWVHMLGFRGHFSTKSRRFSITLGRLRRARQRWHTLAERSRRTGVPIDIAALEARLLAENDDEETTLVVGSWRFQGVGWPSVGDRELAIAAAVWSRERDQHRAHQRAHGRRERRERSNHREDQRVSGRLES